MEELDERRGRLEALYAAHAPEVLAYARRRTDHATAADVLSDVFLVTWRRLDEVPRDALPWLLGCARHALLNHQRADRRRSRLAARLNANASSASSSLQAHEHRLVQALARLEERDREVLLLTAWEGLTTRQAARVLGCSPQAFKVRAHRARKRLADALLVVDSRPTPLKMEACND
jgi:RNA polymerase sigma-70 factor (ECF subfamily)